MGSGAIIKRLIEYIEEKEFFGVLEKAIILTGLYLYNNTSDDCKTLPIVASSIQALAAECSGDLKIEALFKRETFLNEVTRYLNEKINSLLILANYTSPAIYEQCKGSINEFKNNEPYDIRTLANKLIQFANIKKALESSIKSHLATGMTLQSFTDMQKRIAELESHNARLTIENETLKAQILGTAREGRTFFSRSISISQSPLRDNAPRSPSTSPSPSRRAGCSSRRP